MTTMTHMMGVRIDALTPAQLEDRLGEIMRGHQYRQIETINPEFLVRAFRDDEFRRCLNNADINVIDGIGIIIIGRLLGSAIGWDQRCTGVSTTERLLEIAVSANHKVLIVVKGSGLSRPTDIDLALRRLYPGLNYRIIEDNEPASDSIDYEPNICLVALGAPLQELWLERNKAKFTHLVLGVGIGGTFDFISGKIKRAPAWLRELGLEWTWRLIRQPQRLRRILTAVVIFPLLAIKESWQKK